MQESLFSSAEEDLPDAMEWNRQQRERENAQFYAAYAQELRDKFKAGYLSELTPYQQFTVWQAGIGENKGKKLPYNPRTHRLASPTDPATWGTLEDALHALQSGTYHGINFVFTQDDPFLGIDLDHCVHDNRRIDYWQEQLIRRIGSYSEYSPHDGAHLIVKAKLPITTLKRGNLELFNSGHTMSLTLRHIPGTPFPIADRQAELDVLTRVLVSSATEHPAPTVVWQEGVDDTLTEDEQRTIEHWKTQLGNFKRYFTGDSTLWTGSEKKVPSKSEADFVLCLMLLTKTHDDAEQTKRFFRASGLYDPHKTDRLTGRDSKGRPITYLEMTIFNALRKRERR